MKRRIDPNDYLEVILEELKKGILLNTLNEKFNSMSIGWGQIGIVWNIPCFTVYVRESRYTKAALDRTGKFTVSIPLGGGRDRLIDRVCGSMSGFDVDKVKEAELELEPAETNGVPGIRQYPLTIECEVIYSQREEIDALDPAISGRFYPKDQKNGCLFNGRDPHTAYIGRITAAYIIE